MPAATAVRPLTVAFIGNPNTGKSTLFGALSGFRVQTGNYPGVTVEKTIGRMQIGDREVDLIDLPGTYSLSPRSLDEMVAVDVLLGRLPEVGTPDIVVCIVDASNIERNLYLVSQVLDVGLPTVVALNMADVAEARGMQIDLPALSKRLGLPVVSTQGHRKLGLDELRQAILTTAENATADAVSNIERKPRPRLFPQVFVDECEQLDQQLTHWDRPGVPYYLRERVLLDVGGYLEGHLIEADPAALQVYLQAARSRLAAAGCKVPALEAKVRYAWVKEILNGTLVRPATRPVTFSDKLDKFLTHRVAGLVVFALLMIVIFQAISTGAGFLSDFLGVGQDWLKGLTAAAIAPGPLRSLLNDGVIAGVGGVLVFLPQIAILFLFIALLEDCGYMARAAFIMDKLMSRVGLSGKSFVPLMSSFACAIPGVMATRVIENRRDRMTTILVAPLMSCSARQPVYALMIASFIPAALYGWWVPGLVMFGMTFFGALVAIPIAWILKKTVFKGETPPFVMELPTYKMPSSRLVFNRVWVQSKAFVVRAGSLIFLTSILIWALGYFPKSHAEADALQKQIETESARIEPELEPHAKRLEELTATAEALAEGTSERADANANVEAEQAVVNKIRIDLDPLIEKKNIACEELLESSFLGQAGHFIEPAVKPLGWDWRIGVGVIASFPAREVIVATLGTIYSLGGDVDEDNPQLRQALQKSKWPDGRPVYTIAVAFSVMVFFALCAQCASTLMVIRRETGSWIWPVVTFAYMTGLAYVAALVTYQIGSRIG